MLTFDGHRLVIACKDTHEHGVQTLSNSNAYRHYARVPSGSSRLCYKASRKAHSLSTHWFGLTHVVHTPLIRILTRRLVFEQREQELLPKCRAGIEEQRPRGEDNVDGVHVL